MSMANESVESMMFAHKSILVMYMNCISIDVFDNQNFWYGDQFALEDCQRRLFWKNVLGAQYTGVGFALVIAAYSYKLQVVLISK